jgi:hypothetical protein
MLGQVSGERQQRPDAEVPEKARRPGARRARSARRRADRAGADHVNVQVLTASDRHTGRLPQDEWRVPAAALELRAHA